MEPERARRRRRGQRLAGAELGYGGGLTSSHGPMIEDWGPEDLENCLRVQLGWSG